MYMNHLSLFIMLEVMHSLHRMILVRRENISLDCDWFNKKIIYFLFAKLHGCSLLKVL